jgi:hypothetical protein
MKAIQAGFALGVALCAAPLVMQAHSRSTTWGRLPLTRRPFRPEQPPPTFSAHHKMSYFGPTCVKAAIPVRQRVTRARSAKAEAELAVINLMKRKITPAVPGMRAISDKFPYALSSQFNHNRQA